MQYSNLFFHSSYINIKYLGTSTVSAQIQRRVSKIQSRAGIKVYTGKPREKAFCVKNIVRRSIFKFRLSGFLIKSGVVFARIQFIIGSCSKMGQMQVYDLLLQPLWLLYIYCQLILLTQLLHKIHASSTVVTTLSIRFD